MFDDAEQLEQLQAGEIRLASAGWIAYREKLLWQSAASGRQPAVHLVRIDMGRDLAESGFSEMGNGRCR